MNKLIFFVALCLGLSLNTVAAKAADSAVMFYDNGWQEYRGDVAAKMNEPVMNINTQKSFDLKMVNSEGQAAENVSSPQEYFKSRAAGNSLDASTTYAIIDKGLFMDVAMPLFYLSKAQPSKHSYVRNFPFDEKDPLTVLPVTFISWAGSDQRAAVENAVEQKQSWRSIAPNARILEMSEGMLSLYDTFAEDLYATPEEERYVGEMPSHVITPEVLGDFNNDGYEDIVLSYAHYYVGGSGRYYEHVVLTRKSEDAIFEDITKKIDQGTGSEG